MNEIDFYSKQMDSARKLTELITNHINTFSLGEKSRYFNYAMSIEHRTLQQSFTRLILKWLEFISSDEYSTDARNEHSKKVAKILIKAFQTETGVETKPSDFLGII